MLFMCIFSELIFTLPGSFTYFTAKKGADAPFYRSINCFDDLLESDKPQADIRGPYGMGQRTDGYDIHACCCYLF